MRLSNLLTAFVDSAPRAKISGSGSDVIAVSPRRILSGLGRSRQRERGFQAFVKLVLQYQAGHDGIADQPRGLSLVDVLARLPGQAFNLVPCPRAVVVFFFLQPGVFVDSK